MIHQFAFQFYPYIALAVFFIGSWARFDYAMYTWRTGSSQLLSSRGMRLGSNLFHVGVLAILAGHLVGLLTPGGSVVVSLPNIAYALARLRLLRGVWRYERTGIFDDTHLRFFTRATAREMLERAGLRVEAERHIGPASYAVGRPGMAVTRLRPGLLASQLVFLARLA